MKVLGKFLIIPNRKSIDKENPIKAALPVYAIFGLRLNYFKAVS